MKKTLKLLLVVVFLAAILLSLTGCGNKLVATKVTDDDTLGKIEEKHEYTFKGDKIDKVKMTMEFEDKDKAKKGEQQLNAAFAFILALGDVELDYEIELKGKKVIMKLDAEAFYSMEGEAEGATKEELKEQLEEEGYKVK